MSSDHIHIRVTVEASPELTALLERCIAELRGCQTVTKYEPNERPPLSADAPDEPDEPDELMGYGDVVPWCPTCGTELEPGVQTVGELHWTGAAYCPNDHCPANDPHETTYDVKPVYDEAQPEVLIRYAVTQRSEEVVV